MAILKLVAGLVFGLCAISHLAHGTPIDPATAHGSPGNFSDASLDDPGYTWVCTPGRIFNQISDSSPIIAHCQEMIRYIDTYGVQEFDTSEQSTILTRRTCNFGIEGDPHQAGHATVAGGDITYFVKESIRVYGSNNRVGTYGTCRCQSAADSGGPKNLVHVKWGIYA